MKRLALIALALLSASPLAAQECTIEPVGDGSNLAIIKGTDGRDRAVVVLSPEDYDALTNRFDLTWRYLNSTHDKRCQLHGRPKIPIEIDETSLVKRTTYADGFIFEEPFEKKEPKKRPPKLLNVEVAPRRPGSVSARQWTARKARERAEKARPREVVAEFAPGGKVLSVSEPEPENQKETEE